MSKLIATTLAVSGAVAVSVGVIYLLGSKGKSSLDYNSLGEFISKYKEDQKVKGNFVGEIGEESSVSSSPTEGTFFKTGEDTPKGYLKIQHQKGQCDGKLVGRFSWWWIFVKGDEGFINFNLAETVKDSGEDKLKVNGVVFLLAKEDVSGTSTWKVKHKKEVGGDAKKWSSSDLTNKFPKKDTGLQLDAVNDYWGFFEVSGDTSSNPTFSNVASIDDACRPALEQVKPTSYEFTWTPADSSSGTNNKTLKEWANSSSTWWNDIYTDNGGSSAFWDLGIKVATIKGNWTKSQSPL